MLFISSRLVSSPTVQSQLSSVGCDVLEFNSPFKLVDTPDIYMNALMHVCSIYLRLNLIKAGKSTSVSLLLLWYFWVVRENLFPVSKGCRRNILVSKREGSRLINRSGRINSILLVSDSTMPFATLNSVFDLLEQMFGVGYLNINCKIFNIKYIVVVSSFSSFRPRRWTRDSADIGHLFSPK